VDQFCYSACEIEAYGFSQVPGMVVMGQFPTAGVEAETARGDFKLPAGIELTIPTGRFTLPDGSIFLEGQGVQPTIRLAVDQASVLSDQDTVLQAAYDYILNP
jgi:C-terminal processing protease CtpA/Prc